MEFFLGLRLSPVCVFRACGLAALRVLSGWVVGFIGPWDVSFGASGLRGLKF